MAETGLGGSPHLSQLMSCPWQVWLWVGSDSPLAPSWGPVTLPQPLPWSSHSTVGGIIVLCWQDRQEFLLHTHHSRPSEGPRIPIVNNLHQTVSYLLALSHSNHPTANILASSFHLPTAPFRLNLPSSVKPYKVATAPTDLPPFQNPCCPQPSPAHFGSPPTMPSLNIHFTALRQSIPWR